MNNNPTKKKWLKRIGLGLIVFLILAQFKRIDKTNPPIQAEIDFINIMNPSAEIATMIKATCYDCHSNETQYPWYTDVAPVSWWIKSHINGAREHLNFSVWGDYSEKRKRHKLEECYEEIEATKMPLITYVWLHSEAKLTEENRAKLVDWFKSLK